MIYLRPSESKELEVFDELDRQAHARNFIIQTGLESHQKNFLNPKITYLSIENSSGELCGYFVLVVEPDTKSVEFRRILIDHKKRGIGQAAISKMESYCKNEFHVRRIWLDVFEDNEIGMHIYEKMGYKRFKAEVVEGRKLFFYEKAL